MPLTEVEKDLIHGMVYSGVSEQTITGIIMALPMGKQKVCMMKWIILYEKKHGSLPPPDLYPVALRVILKKFPTEAE